MAVALIGTKFVDVWEIVLLQLRSAVGEKCGRLVPRTRHWSSRAPVRNHAGPFSFASTRVTFCLLEAFQLCRLHISVSLVWKQTHLTDTRCLGTPLSVCSSALFGVKKSDLEFSGFHDSPGLQPETYWRGFRHSSAGLRSSAVGERAWGGTRVTFGRALLHAGGITPRTPRKRLVR